MKENFKSLKHLLDVAAGRVKADLLIKNCRIVDVCSGEIREGEIPVFWACGVTPQAAIERAKPPIVITHAPGHMFITNVKNAELNDYLEKKKQGTKSL